MKEIKYLINYAFGSDFLTSGSDSTTLEDIEILHINLEHQITLVPLPSCYP
jgi:hypothetical protein